MKRLFIGVLVIFSSACSYLKPTSTNSFVCEIVLSSKDGSLMEKVPVYSIPSAPGIWEHEGIYCGSMVIQARKRLPSLDPLGPNSWIFYLYGDSIAKNGPIEARFYPVNSRPAEEAKFSSRSIFDSNPCEKLSEEPIIIENIQFSKNSSGQLRFSCSHL